MATSRYTKILPLYGDVNQNVNEITLRDDVAKRINLFRNDKGFLESRPGYNVMSSIYDNGPVDGIYYRPDFTYAIIVQAQIVTKMQFRGGWVFNTDLTGTDVPRQNALVTFCDNGRYVFFANGGKILYTDGTADAAFITDADAPTAVTHVAYMDDRLLCNSVGTNKFYWSDVALPLQWTATSFASASGAADNIIALHTYNRQIYLWGRESLEIWENDGTTPMTRVPGGYIQTTCEAPYSIVQHDGVFYWLNAQQRIVAYKNGVVRTLSTPFDANLQAMRTVADCRAFMLYPYGHVFMIWQFPSANKTYAWYMHDNEALAHWSEWGEYDPDNGWRCMDWNCAAYCHAWQRTLLGAYRRGETWKIVNWLPYYTDTTELLPMRTVLRSGYINHGVAQQKRTQVLRVSMLRGSTDMSSTAVKALIRWRDDGADWQPWRELSLGAKGDRRITLEIWNTGIYRSRQYEVQCDLTVPLVFGEATETFDVLTQ